jgi:hypothetical protein
MESRRLPRLALLCGLALIITLVVALVASIGEWLEGSQGSPETV